jgi:type I restriction enzyme M protein
MDKYDVYQHLMNYWNEVMQDDCYLIAVDGWKAEPYRITVKSKDGKETDKGWSCDLVPKTLVIDRYFLADKQAIEKLEADKESLATQLAELEEEHS